MESPVIRSRSSRLLFGLAVALQSIPMHAQASLFDGELSDPGAIHSRLSTHPSQDFVTEIGIEYLHPELPSISDIIVENPSTSTSVISPTYGTVASDYPDLFAQTVRMQVVLSRPSMWTVGVKTFLPLDGITQIDTGNIYQPEFPLYRSESQRPRILVSSGMTFENGLRVGAGIDVGFSVNSNASVFLQSGAGTVSDQRISAKVKPALIPQVSLGLGETTLVYRGENRGDLDLQTQAGARIFSSTSAGVDFAYLTNSALFFQPMNLELKSKIELSPEFLLGLGISYQFWGRFPSRAAVINSAVPVNCNGNATCTSLFSSGKNPEYQARDLWVPEIELKTEQGQNSYSMGYAFKDSIFKGPPTGIGNYLDPARHDFHVGYSRRSSSGWDWRVHAQISRLSEQSVVKADAASIGGPGYSVSGWLMGGGLSVVIPLRVVQSEPDLKLH